MQSRNYYLKRVFGLRFSVFGFWLVLFCSFAQAQSTNQNYPTPITSNEISGAIRARDLGDARLTSYFYAFNANQGDVFINVVTKNLNGDIDVFTADNLRPLTKIVVYSDSSENETGRVIYLRQAQRLILRIEGRTPDDNPATFRIKFAGSFAPLTDVAETEEGKQPEVKGSTETDVRVNSVGTIIEVKPKPTPAVRETVARKETEEPAKTEVAEKSKPEEKEIAEKAETEEKSQPTEEKKEDKKFEVVVTENLPPREKPEERAEAETEKAKVSDEEKLKEEAKTDPENVSAETKTVAETPAKKEVRPRKPKTRTPAKTVTKPKTAPNRIEEVEPGMLENIRLIVVFKDGGKIEHPMSDILKVGVDKGILTIIYKNGSIGRYSILDVVKMTIE